MSAPIPCKHLNHLDSFAGCILKTCAEDGYPQIKYFERVEVGNENATPERVQFCKKRGRLHGLSLECFENSIFCYEEHTV